MVDLDAVKAMMVRMAEVREAAPVDTVWQMKGAPESAPMRVVGHAPQWVPEHQRFDGEINVVMHCGPAMASIEVEALVEAWERVG